MLVRRVWLVVAVAVMAGCAHEAGSNGPVGPDPGRHRKNDNQNKILLGPEATRHGADVLGAWLAYGAARANAYQQHPPPPANQSADDYVLEYVGRDTQSTFWEQARKKGAPPYATLDRQVEIQRAGFLPEMVVSVYAHPGWTVPGETIKGLRLDEFAKRFPGDYDTKLAVALVSPAGKKFPDVPGADFPDPAALPIGPESCDRQRDERAAAWQRWDALAPRLGGAPVAAQNSVAFAAALNRVNTDPAYLGRGATWVSWRVGHLAYLEGFCAMEARDWSRAVDLLARAASLSPTDVRPRLELGMALATVKRSDEAVAQDRAVIEHTTDGCTIAVALRHEGFAYFDMGLLEAARLAYEKSLEYEPQSAIAAQELKGIAAARASRHDNPKDAASFVPPPASMTTTKCETKAP